MPTLRILLEDNLLATIDTTGQDVLFFYASGFRDQEFLAVLNVDSSSCKDEHGRHGDLSWIDFLPLLQGQTLTVALDAAGRSSHAGVPVRELHPDLPDSAGIDMTVTPAMEQALAALPLLWDSYALTFRHADGAETAISTRPEERGFSFSLLWDAYLPDSARMSVRTSTLESVRARTEGSVHVQEKLHVGQQVSLRLDGVTAQPVSECQT